MSLAEYWHRMRRLLGEEFPAFEQAHKAPRTHALRANTLKIAGPRLAELLGIPLEPVPWAPDGFYFPATERPGIHPFHAAGLYYIQEATAMAAAVALGPRPGERVLDLCAAPGGKATHLAALMGDSGLLVANEPHPKRARILVENLERCGVSRAAVLQEDPDRLAARFPHFFDRILVDAPCSGEGMFRKEPEAMAEWAPDTPAACALRQAAILDAALAMLRPGGWLLYSTCTFAPEENEQTLLRLLRRHPGLEVAELPPLPGADPARPEWAAGPTAAEAAAIGRAVQFWPHRVRGEGHFMALLRWRPPDTEAPEPAGPDAASGGLPRTGAAHRRRGDPGQPARDRATGMHRAAAQLFAAFCAEHLTAALPGPCQLWGEQLYQVPAELPDLAGLRVLRPGLHLGEVRKNRFEPAHALALALPATGVHRRINLPADSPEVLAYLRGEALRIPCPDGWTAVTVDGFPLGWGKGAGGTLKNHYPKGLRWP